MGMPHSSQTQMSSSPGLHKEQIFVKRLAQDKPQPALGLNQLQSRPQPQPSTSQQQYLAQQKMLLKMNMQGVNNRNANKLMINNTAPNSSAATSMLHPGGAASKNQLHGHMQ